jgi:hypothetical protein
MRTVFDGVIAHLGGADNVTELQRLRARRIAFLEAELIHIEDQVAGSRERGEEVKDKLLVLYATLDNSQRRGSEALGYDRIAKDITPRGIRSEIRDEIRKKGIVDIESVDVDKGDVDV